MAKSAWCTAFFSLNDKESLLIVGDLLGCLAEEADVLAQHADTPATARYQLAYDNLATVLKTTDQRTARYA